MRDLVPCVGVGERVAAAVVVPCIDEDALLTVSPVSSIARLFTARSQSIVPHLHVETQDVISMNDIFKISKEIFLMYHLPHLKFSSKH